MGALPVFRQHLASWSSRAGVALTWNIAAEIARSNSVLPERPLAPRFQSCFSLREGSVFNKCFGSHHRD